MLSGRPAEKKEEKMTFGSEFCHVFLFFFSLPDTVIDNEAQSSNLGLGLHLGSVLEQVSDYVCLACPGCHVESCLTSLEDTKKTVISGSFSNAKTWEVNPKKLLFITCNSASKIIHSLRWSC